MGCAGSKLEEERAVMHCLNRSQHLADAIRCRYELADAHAAYVSSLRSVGSSLYDFLSGLHSLPSQPSHHLQLPDKRKGGDAVAPLSAASPPPAIKQQQQQQQPQPVSYSDSHIQFNSSDDDSDADHHLHLHSDDEKLPPGPTYNLSYARSQPAASSVSYEQRPMGPDAVVSTAEQPVTAYPYYGYPPPAQNSNFDPYAAQSSNYYPYQYPYPSYGATNGFFGSSSPPPNIPPPAATAGPGSPSTSRAPPPPPSPPRTSTWDFLNPFESYESYYAPYSPGRSLKDVREEEGIPDLEDEEPEVVKEAYGDKKVAAFSSAAAATMGEYSGMPAAAAAKEDGIKSEMEAGSSSSERDVHVVDKSVVSGADKAADRRNVAARVYHNDSEVVQEIKTQFDHASESADEVSKMLEVGKLPYHQKDSIYKVSARMICGFPSIFSAMDEEFVNFEEEKVMDCGNLSSTLKKLFMWEQKLLDEVRDEERLRVLYERKRGELQHLIDTGAESEELEAIQRSIKKLSTRLRVAMQVVDGISKKISNLRDEELWPELCELIQGLMRMWAIMVECHRTQCQAISEAKNLDSVLSGAKLSDSHAETAKQLELELKEWTATFASWIKAQKSYVNALNDWLNKGIDYEPEVTDDGVIPFSPGRLGAPPIFVICNYWSQGIDMNSESDAVVNAMLDFATSISYLWEQQKLEKRQSLMANNGMDRKLRSMEREDQIMRKKLEAQNKKLLQVMGTNLSVATLPGLHQAPAVEPSSLQSSLQQFFGTMENFTTATAKAYEGLNIQLIEEKERFAREKGEIS